MRQGCNVTEMEKLGHKQILMSFILETRTQHVIVDLIVKDIFFFCIFQEVLLYETGIF